MNKKGLKKILHDDMAQCRPHQIHATRTTVVQFLHSHNLGIRGLPFPPISPNARKLKETL